MTEEQKILSLVIYGSSKDEISKIQKEVDLIFEDYSFYPEVDWGQYGYRPPEGHQVLGAWRHPNTEAFAFLLDNPTMVVYEPTIQLILYLVGRSSPIRLLESKINKMKTEFAIEEKRDQKSTEIGDRLDRIHESKPTAFIMSILSLFTIIINGFSLYLRKLPTPDLISPQLSTIYKSLIVSNDPYYMM